MEKVSENFKGPHPGILACIFTCLFLTGLYFVVSFSTGSPHYPGPWEKLSVIESYFKTNPHSVLLCSFFQFGSAIPLGLYTASMVSKLRFLGVKAAGVYIALFGGFVSSLSLMISSMLLWAIAQPAVIENPGAIGPMYFIGFAIGGVGYSVPLGLLIAGISVTSYFSKLLPAWLSIAGLAIAIIGQLSWLNLLVHALLPLIPLTRFPGFIWLILAGFKLPKTPVSRLVK